MRRLLAILMLFALLASCSAKQDDTTAPPASDILTADTTATTSVEPTPEPEPLDMAREREIKELVLGSVTLCGNQLDYTGYDIGADFTTVRHTAMVSLGELPLVVIEREDDFAIDFGIQPTTSDVSVEQSDGGKIVRVYAQYRFDDGYTFDVTYICRYAVKNPTVTLSATVATQGDMISVVATDIVPIYEYSIYLPHTDTTQPCTMIDGKAFAVAQVNVAATPGDYTMQLRRARDGGEPETVATTPYRVTAREFDRQDLVTTSSTQALYTTENVNSDNEKLRAARTNSNPEPYFDGLFGCPLPDGYKITTEFGEQRYVNDKFQSRHAAYDMAIAEGTDVYATAPGVVTLADELKISGNTVVVDHGAGIFSSYSHLSEIHVEVGDYVEQGAVVGLVGSTGYSTGPHLHFQMVASGYYVDPFYPQQHDLLAVIKPLEQ